MCLSSLVALQGLLYPEFGGLNLVHLFVFRADVGRHPVAMFAGHPRCDVRHSCNLYDADGTRNLYVAVAKDLVENGQ